MPEINWTELMEQAPFGVAKDEPEKSEEDE
jgi:hypothetical protein